MPASRVPVMASLDQIGLWVCVFETIFSSEVGRLTLNVGGTISRPESRGWKKCACIPCSVVLTINSMVLTPSNVYDCHFSATMDCNLELRPQINLFFPKLLMSGCLIAATGNEARLFWMRNGPHRLTCGPQLVPSWLSCCRKQWVRFIGRHRFVVAATLGYTSADFLPWCKDIDHRLTTPWNWSLVQIPYISLLPSPSILHDTLSSPGSLQPLLKLPSWCQAFPCPYAHSLPNRLWVRRLQHRKQDPYTLPYSK